MTFAHLSSRTLAVLPLAGGLALAAALPAAAASISGAGGATWTPFGPSTPATPGTLVFSGSSTATDGFMAAGAPFSITVDWVVQGDGTDVPSDAILTVNDTGSAAVLTGRVASMSFSTGSYFAEFVVTGGAQAAAFGAAVLVEVFAAGATQPIDLASGASATISIASLADAAIPAPAAAPMLLGALGVFGLMRRRAS